MRTNRQMNSQRKNGRSSAPWHMRNSPSPKKTGGQAVGRGRRRKTNASSNNIHHNEEEASRPKSSHGRMPNMDDKTKFQFEVDPETTKPLVPSKPSAATKRKRGNPLNNTSVPTRNGSNQHQLQQQEGQHPSRRINRHGLTAPAIKQKNGILGAISGALGRLKSNTGPVAPNQQRPKREQQNASNQNSAIDLCDSDSDTDGETTDRVTEKIHQRMESPVTTAATSPPQSEAGAVLQNMTNETISNVCSREQKSMHRTREEIDHVFLDRRNPDQNPAASGTHNSSGDINTGLFGVTYRSVPSPGSTNNIATNAASRQQGSQGEMIITYRNPGYITALNEEKKTGTSTKSQHASSHKEPSSFKIMHNNIQGNNDPMNDSFDENATPIPENQPEESRGSQPEFEANLNFKQTDVRAKQQSNDEGDCPYSVPPLVPGRSFASGLKLTKADTVGQNTSNAASRTGSKHGGTTESRKGPIQAGSNSEDAISFEDSDVSNDDERDRNEFSSDDDGSAKKPNSGNNAQAQFTQKGRRRKRSNEKSSSSTSDSISDSQALQQNRDSNRADSEFFGDFRKNKTSRYDVNKTVQMRAPRDSMKKKASSRHTNSVDFGDDDDSVDDPPQNYQRGPVIPTSVIPNFGRPVDSTTHDAEESGSVSTRTRRDAFSDLPGKELSQNANGKKLKQPLTTSNGKRQSPLLRPLEEQRNSEYATSTKSTVTRQGWLEREEKEDNKKRKRQNTRRKNKNADLSDSDYEDAAEKRRLIKHTRSRRRSPRNGRIPPSKEPEMVEILSDSEKDTPMKHDRTQEKGFELDEKEADIPPGICYELSRIALGSMVVREGCKVIFDKEDRMLSLVFAHSRFSTATRKKSTTHVEKIPLTGSFFVRGFVFGTKDEKYTKISADAQGWVAMKIEKDYESLIARLSAYSPESSDYKKKYIILEFPDYDDCMSLVTDMGRLFSDEKFQFLHTSQEKLNCAASLVHDKKIKAGEKKTEGRKASIAEGMESRSKKRSRVKAHQGKGDELLLVYPFPGDKDMIEGAARNLFETNGATVSEDDESADVDDAPAVEAICGDSATCETTAATIDVKVRQRKHFVTIRGEDFKRLDPGEWLNDSLVDFWMQWISRDDTDLHSSNHHFFTSHFYTMLAEQGPESVKSWTAKKNINIFEKKFIFVPINKDLHWSLCVVVNPGAICVSGNDDGEPDPNDPLSCLIFMDSLRMHNKTQVRKNISSWLNSEWKRLKVDGGESSVPLNPFTTNGFSLFNPKVPYQNNTWDCGVFVCRYAYAIYRLRNKNFTRLDAGLGGDDPNTPRKKKGAFYTLITTGNEFDFDMDDIEKFRGDLQTLIDRLSKIYRKMKDEKENAEKEQTKNPKEEEDENENAMVPSSTSSKDSEEIKRHRSEDTSPVEAGVGTKKLDDTGDDDDDDDIPESSGAGTAPAVQNNAEMDNANRKEDNNDDVAIIGSDIVETTVTQQNDQDISPSNNNANAEKGDDMDTVTESVALCMSKREATDGSDDENEVSPGVGRDCCHLELSTQPDTVYQGLKVDSDVETVGSSSSEDEAKSEADQLIPGDNNEEDGREEAKNVFQNNSKNELQEIHI